MIIRKMIGVLLICLGLFGFGCSSSSSSEPSQADLNQLVSALENLFQVNNGIVFQNENSTYKVTVSGTELSGSNPSISLTTGTTYTIYNQASSSHPLQLIQNGQVVTTIASGGSYSLVANSANVTGLIYVCELHSSMTGTFSLN